MYTHMLYDVPQIIIISFIYCYIVTLKLFTYFMFIKYTYMTRVCHVYDYM